MNEDLTLEENNELWDNEEFYIDTIEYTKEELAHWGLQNGYITVLQYLKILSNEKE